MSPPPTGLPTKAEQACYSLNPVTAGCCKHPSEPLYTVVHGSRHESTEHSRALNLQEQPTPATTALSRLRPRRNEILWYYVALDSSNPPRLTLKSKPQTPKLSQPSNQGMTKKQTRALVLQPRCCWGITSMNHSHQPPAKTHNLEEKVCLYLASTILQRQVVVGTMAINGL